MVKVERTYPGPKSLEVEKEKKNGKCNLPDVIQLLLHDFHKKCYICEMKNPSDIEVEHLLPHKNGKDIERKFSWDNIFLACPHCNNIKKSKKYDEHIIDCCKEDPEDRLVFELIKGEVKVNSEVYGDKMAEYTAELLNEVFNLKIPELGYIPVSNV